MVGLKNELIKKAKREYGEIFPCGEKLKIEDCFTYEKTLGKIFFWFNCTKDNSTRVLSVAVEAH